MSKKISVMRDFFDIGKGKWQWEVLKRQFVMGENNDAIIIIIVFMENISTSRGQYSKSSKDNKASIDRGERVSQSYEPSVTMAVVIELDLF